MLYFGRDEVIYYIKMHLLIKENSLLIFYSLKDVFKLFNVEPFGSLVLYLITGQA